MWNALPSSTSRARSLTDVKDAAIALSFLTAGRARRGRQRCAEPRAWTVSLAQGLVADALVEEVVAAAPELGGRRRSATPRRRRSRAASAWRGATSAPPSSTLTPSTRPPHASAWVATLWCDSRLSRPPTASSSARIAKIGHAGASVSTSTANSRHGSASAPIRRTRVGAREVAAAAQLLPADHDVVDAADPRDRDDAEHDRARCVSVMSPWRCSARIGSERAGHHERAAPELLLHDPEHRPSRRSARRRRSTSSQVRNALVLDEREQQHHADALHLRPGLGLREVARLQRQVALLVRRAQRGDEELAHEHQRARPPRHEPAAMSSANGV